MPVLFRAEPASAGGLAMGDSADESESRQRLSSTATAQRALRQTLDGLRGEVAQPSGCTALAFMLVFWVVFLVTQIGHRQIRLQNSMMLALTSTLKSSFVVDSGGANATAAEGRRLIGSSRFRADIADSLSQALDHISDTDGILRWVSQTMVPQIWLQGPAGPGVLFKFNRAVGGIRLVQRRLEESECPGSRELREVYNLTCYRGSLGRPGDAELADLPGLRVSDDHVQTYWLDLSSTEATVQEQIQQLWDSDWLSPATEDLLVQTVLLNVQVNLLAFVEVAFRQDRVGRIVGTASVLTLPTRVYGQGDWLVWLGDGFMLLLLLCLAISEVRAIAVACKRRSFEDCRSRARALNFLVLGFGMAFSLFFAYLAAELQDLAACIAAVPALPQADGPGPAGWIDRHSALDSVYEEVGRLSELLRGCELSTFWYSLVLLFKLFSVFEASPRLTVLTATMRQCGTDILHFLVIFFVVFVTFSLGAYFLFGHQLAEWSNIAMACNSSFRALMGDFDVASMYNIAPISSTVWFWLFMSVVCLVMLNMLLAIILETYSAVKEQLAGQQTLWDQVGVMKTETAKSIELMGILKVASKKRREADLREELALSSAGADRRGGMDCGSDCTDCSELRDSKMFSDRLERWGSQGPSNPTTMII